jgi:hypothetical protein
MVEEKKIKVIRPQEGYQMEALSSNADIVIGGGAAGAGKTFSLLLKLLTYILTVVGFGAVIFRRTTPQIKNEGGLWDTSFKLYSKIKKATAVQSSLTWYFKIGSAKNKLKFSHIEHEKNVHDWQGSQIPFIGFDELTHFSKKMFFYLLTRNRSVCGVKPQVHATCNPDPWSWVKELIQWWIDENTGLPIPERSGVIRYFFQEADSYIWGDTYQEVYDQAKHLLDPLIEKTGYKMEDFIKSITFIAGNILENTELLSEDPGYLANLVNQDEQTKASLFEGNWNVKLTAKDIYNFYKFKNIFGREVFRGTKRLIADIALEGSNKFVIAYFEGRMLLDLRVIAKSNGKEVIQHLEEMKAKHRVENNFLLFDSDGVGGFVSGYLEGSIPFSGNNAVIEIEDPTSKKLIKENYQNQKTQLIYHSGRAVDNDLYGMSEEVAYMMYDEKMTVQQRYMYELRAFKKASDNGGKLRVISKDEMKKLLNGDSPDLMDVFWMNEYFELSVNIDHYSGWAL